MNRLDVIQALMRQKGLKNYLEIGVENGHIFFRIKSSFKVAVDPKFIFDASRRFGKAILNPYNLTNKYFEKTSDDFFAQDAQQVFAGITLQLALVDGMHEYLFALRDVENTLTYMGDDGVIIMHDCNPQTAGAAGRFEDWEVGEWNGDVWKTIIHLRSQRPDLNIFVLDCDQGLGIVTRRKPESKLDFTPAQIQSLTYDDLVKDRKKLINLKPADYFYEYFGLKAQ
ncbi:class I SAM-dependent methyltransferase [Spirosoma sp. KCTC 42546]|uniref:class I SAM-dependent methyltransferase n=1 Tax=Spirosoma sp. KCTC 42546 TaxID=2520506 RepID=UPI00115C158B|nr:class I SAM-dependent methyltransferase [Spirosoma sp. KCTC 42546]QDK83251.1 class I SAM-dependent methyltransferase [Spirosoma sp. KCTC 42546]